MNLEINLLVKIVDEVSSFVNDASNLLAGENQQHNDSTSSTSSRDVLIRAQALLKLCLESIYMQREDEIKSYIKNCNDSLGAMIEGMKVVESKTNRIEYDNSINVDICIDPLVSNKQKVICYDDIIGNDFAKQALKENIMYQFLLPKEVKNKLFTGIRKGAGNVLLYGPPGVGKTILVQATAYESCSTLFSVNPSDILSKYQGESERYIKSLFRTARNLPRSVVFFDGSKIISFG